MLRSWLLPAIALVAAAYTTYHVVTTNQSPPPTAPPIRPAQSPFGATLAGAGIVEARTENISVGSQLPGVVSRVLVEVDQPIEKDMVLFELDDRHLQADLKVRTAERKAAQAQLDRLTSMPRPEEIPPSEAKVRRLEAELAAAKDLMERAERLYEARSVGEEEWIQRRQAVAAAKELLQQAKDEDSLLKKGAWASDIAVAEASVALAEQQVQKIEVEIDRLKVKSPIAGRVLQVNVRPGEYVGAPPGEPLIVLGDLDSLRVRIDIDESDIPDFQPGMPARAFLRGQTTDPIPLRFVRVEPYVIPKRSLTRAAGEHVDTRVLQVIYEVDKATGPLYVGQLLDVFFDASLGREQGAGDGMAIAD